MSDSLKKLDRIKTPLELLNEASEIASQQEIAPNSNSPIADRFLKVGLIYFNLNKENEAWKSHEQRAREDAEKTRRWAREREEKAQAKTEKEHLRLNGLFLRWCKRDTWLIHDEAIALAKSREPNTNLLLDVTDNGLWELVQSCAGHSLKVVNIAEKPHRWRVEPREWARWLKEKGQAVPQELINIILPKPYQAEPEKKTSRATQTREKKCATRLQRLRNFSRIRESGPEIRVWSGMNKLYRLLKMSF